MQQLLDEIVYDKSVGFQRLSHTDPLSCPALNRLQQIDVPFGMWTPNNGSIFQNSVYNCLVCHTLDLTTAAKHQAPQAIQRPGSFRSNKLTMVMPFSLESTNNPRYFTGLCQEIGY